MCPTFNFNFFTTPLGNSKTKEYLRFQKYTLFGKSPSLILTILLFLSKIRISKGVFTKNVCMPSLVFKNKTLSLYFTAPKSLSFVLSKCKTFKFNFVSEVEFLIIDKLYLNFLEFKKEYNT